MNPYAFDDKRIAEGYAKDRPFLHPQVLEKALERHGSEDPFFHGLDVGCGEGLSTKALKKFCKKVTGTDISEKMIDVCKTLYPEEEYTFTCSAAEKVGKPKVAFDLVTAAGVVNWIEEKEFFLNLRKIMNKNGVLLVYDFWITDRMVKNPAYTNWYQKQYLPTFPKPPRKEHRWSQQILPDTMRMVKQEEIELTYDFTLNEFIRFMMIQSGVNICLESKVRTKEEVHAWFNKTLLPIWEKEKQTLVFEGYYWKMTVR